MTPLVTNHRLPSLRTCHHSTHDFTQSQNEWIPRNPAPLSNRFLFGLFFGRYRDNASTHRRTHPAIHIDASHQRIRWPLSLSCTPAQPFALCPIEKQFGLAVSSFCSIIFRSVRFLACIASSPFLVPVHCISVADPACAMWRPSKYTPTFAYGSKPAAIDSRPTGPLTEVANAACP